MDDFALEFEAFWRAFPIRVAKRAAFKSFINARKRGGTLEAILAGISNYITHKPAWQAYAHPSTWLNGDRWEDEYAPAEPKLTLASAFAQMSNYQGNSNGQRPAADSQPARPALFDLSDERIIAGRPH